MAKFSRGRDAEDRLITMLKSFGCQIMAADAVLDHEKKLDFVVLSLPEFPSLLVKPLGVQVTMNVGQHEKREEFFRRSLKNPYAPKNLYLEIDGNVNLEEGGAFSILVAITEFLIDKRFASWTMGAVRIAENLTYEFRTSSGTAVMQAQTLPTDIVETLDPEAISEPMSKLPIMTQSPTTKPPEPSPAPPPEVPQLALSAMANGGTPEALQTTPTPDCPEVPKIAPPPQERFSPSSPTVNGGALRFPATTQRGTFGIALSKAMGVTLLSGRITRFNAGLGMGTIVATGGVETEYFLHWKNIGDQDLLTTLNELPRSEQWLTDPIAVQFADGGISDGKKNRKALDIKRLTQ